MTVPTRLMCLVAVALCTIAMGGCGGKSSSSSAGGGKSGSSAGPKPLLATVVVEPGGTIIVEGKPLADLAELASLLKQRQAQAGDPHEYLPTDPPEVRLRFTSASATPFAAMDGVLQVLAQIGIERIDFETVSLSPPDRNAGRSVGTTGGARSVNFSASTPAQVEALGPALRPYRSQIAYLSIGGGATMDRVLAALAAIRGAGVHVAFMVPQGNGTQIAITRISSPNGQVESLGPRPGTLMTDRLKTPCRKSADDEPDEP